MLLLSKHSAIEYLLWLKTNDCGFWEDSFLKTAIKEPYKNLKVFSLKSATRNFIYEFEFDKTKYILKQFRDPLKNTEKYFKAEESNLNSKRKYFGAELSVLNDKTFGSTPNLITPKLIFKDENNSVLIQENLFDYVHFDNILTEYYRESYDICPVLESLASVSKIIHQSKKVEQPKFTEPFMRGKLKQVPDFFEYYKKYLSSWQNNGFIHGDFYVRNILANTQNNTKIKVIDWELSCAGDCYYDLVSVIHDFCINIFGESFFRVPYDGSTQPSLMLKYGYLKQNIKCFLDAYDSKIDMDKIKTFLIINTQHLSDNPKVFLNNINQIFS
jgi:thiamine kinase-like enzyme